MPDLMLCFMYMGTLSLSQMCGHVLRMKGQRVAMFFGGMAKDLELLWRPGAGMSSTLSLAVHCTWKIYVTTDSVPAMKLKYVCG